MADASSGQGRLKTLRTVLPRWLGGDAPVVPVVRLTGLVGFSTPFRPGLTLASCARALDRAFGYRQPAAVALSINSPGGSAAQAHLIFGRIRQLAEAKQVPVLAFVEDVAASGGYMIACAADEIIADENSIVGSIGVVGGSFGFSKLMEKIGVERRLYVSGARKAMLDPFLPENPDDVARLKAIQREIHENFIGLVRERRGPKLRGDEEDVFSGEFWTGKRGLALGLVDGVGELRTTLRARFGDRVLTPLVAGGRGFLGLPIPGIDLGLSEAPSRRLTPVEDLIATLEARAWWGRYGL
ncbi:MAG: S49 family peptidase [Variibacter sp.]|nr:S49 family peptidase [Variibacter sp.]